jgi:hypothetical protein
LGLDWTSWATDTDGTVYLKHLKKSKLLRLSE